VPVAARPQYQRKYCSDACRAWAARHEGLRPVARRCARCSADISDRHVTARYCSSQCAWRTRFGFIDKVEVECPRCGATFIPNSARHKYCTTKCSRAVYQEKFRAENPEWVSEWRRRSRPDQLRRARIRGARVVEKFKPIDIYERDKWRCGLCRKRVRKSLRWPDPMSASLDHLVPISCGGEHVRANVQLAHLGCNVRKNARGGGEQLMLFG